MGWLRTPRRPPMSERVLNKLRKATRGHMGEIRLQKGVKEGHPDDRPRAIFDRMRRCLRVVCETAPLCHSAAPVALRSHPESSVTPHNADMRKARARAPALAQGSPIATTKKKSEDLGGVAKVVVPGEGRGKRARVPASDSASKLVLA